MKRIITLLFLTLISQSIFAQKLDYDHDSKWFLGLNTGVAWNTTDVKNKSNLGWGLTLGRAFNYNYGKKVSFDLRFRYLGAKWKGQDYDTTSMTGYNSSINPAGNVHAYYDALGFTINNFQTQVHEFGLELAIHANSLRENSGWDPYIFGGVNMVFNQTKGDLYYNDTLLSTQNIYNYSPDGMSKKDWKDMRDKKYDLALDGSSLSSFNVDFMPSLGFGLGYQVGPRFQIGLEHKTTFTLNDLFDGYIDPTLRWGMFQNDIYHYTNFYLKFHIRHYTDEEKEERQKPTQQTTQTNPTQTTSTPNNGGCVDPKISLNQPNTNSITVYGDQYKIKALIEEVAGRNNIVFKVNGQASTNFIYNPNNEQFEANVFLQPGNNIITIEAGNACGKVDKRITINYIQCTAPIIEFVSPQGNGVTVTNSNYVVNANVVNATTVEYYVNGNRVTSFSHNNATGNFSSNTILKRGSNVLRIVAKNDCGTVEQSTSIDFTTCVSPLVTIASGSNSQIVDNNQFTFQATITDVSNQNDINLRLNGMNKTFSFNATTHQFVATLTLISGTNTIELFGSNSCGTDRKIVTIEYVPCSLPTVTILSPSNGNSTSAQSNVKVQLTGISNRSQLQLRVNGSLVSSGTYDASTQLFQANIALNNGVNTIIVTATNDCGTVNQSVNTTFSPCIAPVVTMILPNQTMTTQNTTIVKASLANITNRNQIVVTINGSIYSGGSYNAITRIYQANISVQAGSNSIQIKATNNCGNDLKTVNIQYKPCSLPTVTILSLSNGNSTSAQSNVKVQLTGISNRSQLQLRVNGSLVSSGTYDVSTQLFQTSVALSNGVNTFTMTATNDCGTVNQSVNTIYSPCIAPVVTMILPNQTMTTQNTTIVKASLANITNRNQIVVTINGSIYSGGSYNAITQIYQANISVQAGSNSIQIKAINNCGNDLKTVNIQYKPCYSPIISIVSPLESSIIASSVVLSVALQNVSSTNQVQATINGQLIATGNYSSTTKRYEVTVNLIDGTNNIVIIATNSCGTVNQSIQIKKIIEPQKILICHQPQKKGEKPVKMYIQLSEWAIHQAHGDVLGACPQVVDPTISLEYTICHTDPQTGVQSTITIPAAEWPTHLAHGDLQEPCPVVTNEKIITICHSPTGTTIKEEMQIPESEWATHEAHGDYLGSCTQTGSIGGGNQSDSITICHHVPGSTETVEMVIPQIQWLIHQAHGDNLGPCPGSEGLKSEEENQENKPKGKKKETVIKP